MEENTGTVFKMNKKGDKSNEIQKKVSQTFQPHYSNCLSAFSQELQARELFLLSFLSKFRRQLPMLLNIKDQSNSISLFTNSNFKMD